MKKLVLSLTALLMTGIATLVAASPAHAAYPDCTWAGPLFCNWVANPTFDSAGTPAPWNYSPGTTFPQDVRCGYATRVAKMKRISPDKEWMYQRMYIDAALGAGPRAQVVFKLELRDDTDSFYDQLRVIVKNLDTNAIEKMEIHGNNFSSTCPIAEIQWSLANDYRNRRVELRFEIASFSTGTFIIDDVQFWTF